MTDKEKILSEIERLLKHSDFNNGDVEHGYDLALLDVKRFVNSTIEEPVSNDLEEASYRFACKCNPLKTEYSTTSPNPEIIKAFKTGAKWKEEQIMKDAIDAKLLEGHLIRQKDITHPLHVGDKVKVIIIKN